MSGRRGIVINGAAVFYSEALSIGRIFRVDERRAELLCFNNAHFTISAHQDFHMLCKYVVAFQLEIRLLLLIIPLYI
jgi:hypothetical protein